MPRALVRFSLASVLGLAFGCHKSSTPIDPAVLGPAAAVQASGMLHASASSVAFTDRDGFSGSQYTQGISHAQQGLQHVPVGQPIRFDQLQGTGVVRGLAARRFLGLTVAPSVIRRHAPRPPGYVELTETGNQAQIDEDGGDLEVFLRDRVLVASNLESKDDSSATYLLKADPTCRGLPSSGSMDINSGCAQDLAKVQVRVVMRADGDGVRLSWQVGPERAEAFALVIHSDLIAIELGLADTKKAVDAWDRDTGAKADSTVWKALTGRIRFALKKDGPQAVTASFSVLEAIDIKADNASGKPEVYLSTEKRDPLLAVGLDGTAETITVTTNLGITEAQQAWDPHGTGAVNTDLHVVLGGLTGVNTLSNKSTGLAIHGFGLGAVQTHVDVRGQAIVTVDLNQDAGRKFDLTGSIATSGEPRFDFNPSFDLEIGYHLGLIASDYDTPPPSEFLDETYRFSLTGPPAPAIEAVAANAAKMFDGGLRVDSGTLTVASSKAAAPVVVPTGKCLTSTGSPPAGGHPLLGALVVVDCP